MIVLDKKNIIRNCTAKTSDEAIIEMGNILMNAGLIQKEYIEGMLKRDHSLSVYIGNDIAIPHGEFEYSDDVIQSGIAIMIYPDGINWAGNHVRLVIGIAAKNNAHMEILANIAETLYDMDVVEQVIHGDVEFIYDVLGGE